MTFIVAVAICGLVPTPGPLPVPPGACRPAQSRPTVTVSQDRHAELERAKRLLRQGAVDEAASALRAAVERDPNDADAYLLLGRALSLVPDPAQAIIALRRAVELRPASVEAHYTLGAALARFGDVAAALPFFEKAIALDPRFADAHISLALIRAQQKQPGAARDHLARAIDLQGRSPAAAYPHYLMAQILREEGKLEPALQHLTAAIERRPDYAEAYLSRGLIMRELLDEPGALQAFQTAVRFSPEDPAARSQLGAAYLRNDRAADAIPHLEHALRLKPDERFTQYQLCRALRLAGRTPEAERCAQQVRARFAAESAADDLSVGQVNNEGVELEAAGDLTAAIERYRKAVALDPDNAVFRRNLALALCRSGRWEDGIEELKRVLATNPNDHEATRALYIAITQARARKDPGEH